MLYAIAYLLHLFYHTYHLIKKMYVLSFTGFSYIQVTLASRKSIIFRCCYISINDIGISLMKHFIQKDMELECLGCRLR
jgi:hypothetical protein